MPAMHAERYDASVPQNRAFTPSFARSFLLFGASSPMPPIWIAIEPRLAKPQSAKLAIITLLGLNASFSIDKSRYAINSLNTSFVPISEPTMPASLKGTPIANENNEKMLPSISFSERCLKSNQIALRLK